MVAEGVVPRRLVVLLAVERGVPRPECKREVYVAEAAQEKQYLAMLTGRQVPSSISTIAGESDKRE